ncbi:MAG: leucine-rich repeat domain-containing protein, partial [Prevotella sp.]|nr:leucine-rich repeat domain-containing protein [Prevotella sp.]
MKKNCFYGLSVALIFVCSNLSLVANATVGDTFEDENSIKYEVITDPVGSDNGTVKVVANSYTGSVSIPATVTDSNSNTYDVTEIGEQAFQNCTGVTSIDLSNASNLTTIGYEAFYGCSSITEITIPESVTSIVLYAFQNCSSLSTLTYNAKNAKYYQEDGETEPTSTPFSAVTTVTIGEDVESLPGSLFRNLSSLESVTFTCGSSLTSMGSFIFYSCTSLTSIEGFDQLSSLTEIPTDAFNGCTALSVDLVIPSSVDTIANFAFNNTGIKSVEINADVPFGTSAFTGCTSLRTLTIRDSEATTLSSGFGQMTNLDTLNYNATNITTASANILAHATDLSIAVIGNNVVSIPSNLLWGCSNLSSVTFNESSSLTTVGDDAFYNCSSLESIDLPSTVTKIGSYAFYGSGLTEFTVNENVDSIGDNAFQNCSSLSTLTYNAKNAKYYQEDGETEPTSTPFSAVTTVTIGEDVESLPGSLFRNLSSLESVTFTCGSSLTSMGSFIFHSCTGLTSIEGFDQLSSLTEIPTDAFNGCTSLAGSLVIPNSVDTIADYAFYNTAITSVTINSGIKIGAHAFDNCASLDTLTLGEGVTSIPYNIREMGNLKILYYNARNATMKNNTYGDATGSDFVSETNLATVVIGDSVQTLPHHLFANCTALDSLIYNAIECTSIGESAFNNCTNLKILTIGENVEKIPEALNQLTHVTTLYYNAANASVVDGDVEDLTESVFGTTLNDVEIGAAVTKLPDYLFADCTGITTVNTDNTNDVLTEIGKAVFKNCTGIST